MRRTSLDETHNSPMAAGGGHSDDAGPAGGRPGGVAADAELEVLVNRLAAVLGDQGRLEGLSTDGLRSRIGLLRRVEGLAAAGTAASVRVLQAAGGVAEDGVSSTTAWVAANTGRSRRDASRVAMRASTLPELPATAEALAAGTIGGESADAIIGACRDGRLGSPGEVEAGLLPVALSGSPEQVRRQVRSRLQAVDGGSMLADEATQQARRRLFLSPGRDGMWQLWGQLPPETGEAARTLLDVFDGPDPDGTPEGARRDGGQRLADAFHAAVMVALGCGELPSSGGVARPHVSVVVDVATLDADLADPDDPDRPVAPDDPVWSGLPAGQADWGRLLSPQAVRRICCDAVISRIVTAGASQPLDVGRETRTWSPAQRRAINVRDRACRGPGCHRPLAWTAIHHLQWWRHDGHTDVDNGLALCHHCHRLIHDHGWHAHLDVATAVVTWTCPDRRRTVVTHPRPPG